MSKQSKGGDLREDHEASSRGAPDRVREGRRGHERRQNGLRCLRVRRSEGAILGLFCRHASIRSRMPCASILLHRFSIALVQIACLASVNWLSPGLTPPACGRPKTACFVGTRPRAPPLENCLTVSDSPSWPNCAKYKRLRLFSARWRSRFEMCTACCCRSGIFHFAYFLEPTTRSNPPPSWIFWNKLSRRVVVARAWGRGRTGAPNAVRSGVRMLGERKRLRDAAHPARPTFFFLARNFKTMAERSFWTP